MTGKEVIEMLVEGGKANPDPSSAQKLSAYKLNIGDVFKKVNEQTAVYKGMQVPVKIIIDKDTKSVDVEVGTPPVSSMIKKELGIEKAKLTEEGTVAKEGTTKEGASKEDTATEDVSTAEKNTTTGKTVLGSLTVEQCVKIAKMKIDEMLVKDLKSAVKQVIGTAGSMMGIQVEDKNPKEVLKEIDEGKWDELLR